MDNRVCETATTHRRATPMTGIAQKRKEVEHAVQAAVDAVEKDGHRTAQAVELAAWACLLVLGRR